MGAILLKQNTAYTFQLGPFLDSTDGNTPETALTIAAGDVFVSKGGAAFAAKNETTALTGTSDSRGYYDCLINATDTNSLWWLRVHCHPTGALPVWQDFLVLPAQVYDSLVAGSDTLDVQVTGIGANVITATSINGGAITSAKLDASAITAIQAGLALDADMDSVLARLPAALVGGRMDASLGAIDNDTTALAAFKKAYDTSVGAVPSQGVVDRGTLQAATASTAQLRSAFSIADDRVNGCQIEITGGTGFGQARYITDYDNATDTATVSPAWTTVPDNTSTYQLTAVAPSAPAAPPAVNVTHVMGRSLVLAGSDNPQYGVNP